MARHLPPLFLVAILLSVSPVPTGAHDGPEKFDAENATYLGVEETAIRLANGIWEGEPYIEGGAARPRVGLVRDFLVLGDLNGDGRDEAVVALWRSSGGSGTFQYIAVLEPTGEGGLNRFTAPVGDRVRIESGRIENGQFLLNVVQHGPDEPACCPTQAVTRLYDANLNLLSTQQRNPK